MEERTAKLEVAREVVLEIYSKHRLALHAVVGVTFERHIYVSARIQQTLVDDGNGSTAVVNGIVNAFRKCHTVGGNNYRTFGHIISAERNFARLCSAVFTREDELILFGNLLGNGLGRVVEFLEHILVRNSIVANHLAQVAAERFYDGEEDAPRRSVDGVPLNEVKIGVRVLTIVVVQAVKSEKLKQTLVLQTGVGEVSEVNTRSVA